MENIKAKIQAILMNNSQKSVIGWAVEEDDFEEVAEEIVKNCFIPNVVGQSEQLSILDRCGCEEPNEEPIKVCMNCNGYVE